MSDFAALAEPLNPSSALDPPPRTHPASIPDSVSNDVTQLCITTENLHIDVCTSDRGAGQTVRIDKAGSADTLNDRRTGHARSSKVIERTMSQEEHNQFLASILRDHPSVVYMLPLSAHQLQGQATAARKMGHHTRILRAQSSWGDPSRNILIFGKDSKIVEEQYGRIQKRAASGLPWKEIINGIGIARGLIKELMSIWSLFR